MSGRAVRLPAVDPAHCAFLLDFDGTLIGFAPHPDRVRVGGSLLQLVTRLQSCAHGAVALVSGRSIATLDRLFRPLRLPASGLHGAELRTAGHVQRRPVTDASKLQSARALLEQVAASDAGLYLEDKDQALALHFRGAPHLAQFVTDAVQEVAVSTGLRVLRGPMVFELVSGETSKATGVQELMNAAPFHGRRPVYLGDDLLDEPAFAWVNAAGGISLAVAPRHPTVACWRLPSVRAARAWLQRLVQGAD